MGAIAPLFSVLFFLMMLALGLGTEVITNIHNIEWNFQTNDLNIN